MPLTKISSSEISTGAITADKIANNVTLGGPKITTVNVANSTYTVLDDTAVNVGGGYIVVTGAGFQSGAQVIIDTTPATSTTFVNSTTLRAEVPTKSAATYNLYVVNSDGGTAIKVNGLTYSGVPTWVTGSTLANVSSNQAFTGSLSATGATSYAVASGSSLPTGMTLVTANGYYYGTISVGSETTYNFTINAIDAENQDSPRSFSLTATVVSAPTSVEYLVVAGGGGGGGWSSGTISGGGGGAGGYRTGTLSVSAGTPYTVTIGAGGSGTGSGGSTGSNGGNSVLSTITSNGGGGGGGSAAGNNGGSGGGGGGIDPSGTSGGLGNSPSTTPSQGNNGGAGVSFNRSGGGGGAGVEGTASGGGDGLQSSITGTSTYYAGGGGNWNGGTGPAGLGGGGTIGVNGSTNTGGGGGGSSRTGAVSTSGAGGSGIVIIRYADSFSAATSTTGSPTVTTSGGYRIYTWTGSGSITF